MDIKKITELHAGRQWTAMLAALPPGNHTISFETLRDINSCKAIAYALNSNNIDGKGRKYTFNVDKPTKTVVIKVKDDGND